MSRWTFWSGSERLQHVPGIRMFWLVNATTKDLRHAYAIGSNKARTGRARIGSVHAMTAAVGSARGDEVRTARMLT